MGTRNAELMHTLMIKFVDEQLIGLLDSIADAKRHEIHIMHTAYYEVCKYSKWVMNPEVMHAEPKFDVSLLNKVYIGNVVCSKSTILDILNVFGRFSINYICSKECVFVDFDNPHAAYLCMEEVNGMVVDGKSLKAGRTSSFPSEIPHEIRNPDKCIVYVSNVSQEVEEAHLEEIFSGIGKVNSVRLLYDSWFVHKGYAYVKFEFAADARRALGYTNKICIYGMKLRIGPTVIKMEMPEPVHHSEIPKRVFEIKRRIESMLFSKGRMVVLKNLIDDEEADDEFEQEIQAEMRKLGNVVKFVVLKIPEVAVYCMYSSEDEARHSFGILNGRFFGGRRIRAEMSSEEFPE